MTRKKHIIKDLSLSEISGVTVPAQSHALAAIWKSDSPEVVELTKYLSTDDGAKSFDAFLADEVKQKQRSKIYEQTWPLIDALRDSIVSIRVDSALSDDEKEQKIGESVAQFAAACQHPLSDVISVSELTKQQEPDNMSVELEKKAGELEAQVAELTKKLEVAESISKMSAKEREYMSQLDDEAAEEFRAAAKEKRDAMMKKSAESDEVFKSADGHEIRKSVVGEGVFAILKSQDELLKATREEMVKAAERAQTVELTKRAEEEFGALPGETVAKVAVLKAVSLMDEAAQATLTAMLKAGNDALAGGFKEIGKSGGRPQDVTKAAKRDDLVKAHMAANPNVTKAMAEVAIMSAHPDLYEG